jgi:hypothetical protein
MMIMGYVQEVSPICLKNIIECLPPVPWSMDEALIISRNVVVHISQEPSSMTNDINAGLSILTY